MTTFNVDKLMENTRQIAIQFREQTGKTLPISQELAKYDAEIKLNLLPVSESGLSYDCTGQDEWLNQKFIIKSRVIFNTNKSHYRLGQVNTNGDWDNLVLVLYRDDYLPYEMRMASKSDILALMQNHPSQRGMSLAKFSAVANVVWSC